LWPPRQVGCGLRFRSNRAIDDLQHAEHADIDGDGHDPIIDRFEQRLSAGDGARYGAKWMATSRIMIQLSQFGFGIVNARLLVPAEFGIAAVPIALVGLAEVFTDIGLAAAIVQADVATRRMLNTAFWLNLGAGLVIALACVLLAEPLALFYGNQQIAGLMLIVALGFAFTRGSVQTAVLERTYQYRRLAIVETTAFFIGAVVTPALAIAGVGAAAIVIGAVSVIVMRSLLLWLAVRWRPTMRPHRQEARELWRYSRGLVGFNVLNYWTARNIDTLVLARTVSAQQLGEYTRAYNLMMVPVRQTSQILGRVLFPSLSRLAHDPPRVASAWIRGCAAAAFVTMPIAITIAATAPSASVVLYGPNWSGMSPDLTLLALAALPQTISASTGAVYRAIDQTAELFRRGVYTTIMTVVAVLIGVSWGTVGVAAALAVNASLGLVVMTWPLIRRLHITPHQLRPLLPAITITCAVGAAELAVWFLLPSSASPFVTLTLQLMAGGAAFLAASFGSDNPVSRIIRQRLGGAA
jgi:O-antigen/teichoic acid export membrane protein